MKNLTSYPHHRWQKVLRSLTFAVAVAGVALLVPGGGQTQGPPTPAVTHQDIQAQLTTHDAAQAAHDAAQAAHNTAQNTSHGMLQSEHAAHDAAQAAHDTALTTHDAAQTAHITAQTAHDLALTTHDSAQTTQHNGLPQAWDKTLPANDLGGPCPANSSRFTCVMGNAAVRDNETGLVWEKSPPSTLHTWSAARGECKDRTVGGRRGWRVPSVHELASLVDPINLDAGGVHLPPGHPFTLAPFATPADTDYWSATSNADNPTTFAWFVFFLHGTVGADGAKTGLTPATIRVWCVRGAMNADQY